MNQYELIETMREDKKFAVTELCEALGVSRSGFYAWKERPPSAREKENTELVAAIREIHSDRHTKVYGSPRMTEELRDRELCVGENRVARLMRQEGIRARSKRAFRPKTTVQDEDAKCRIAPNRLAELEEITAPGQALVGDITYVATREGCKRSVSSALTPPKKPLILGACKDARMKKSASTLKNLTPACSR
ncbi:MAG: IS3 family transposase [Verrucomicrobiota bacterium]